MKILYFAWLRERLGVSEEDLALPADVRTVADVIAFLSERDEVYAHAFAGAVVRAALDKKHVSPGASITGAREIAFFPPMTGG